MPLALSHREQADLHRAATLLTAPPGPGGTDAWRREVNRALRAFVGADKAYFCLRAPGCDWAYSEEGDPEAVRAYVEHFHQVDRGLRRLEARRLEVWSRAMLWERDELEGSEIYRGLHCPYGLHDTVGMREAGGAGLAQSMVLLHQHRPEGFAGCERRAALLRLALPAFRAGMRGLALQLESAGRLRALVDTLDVALALADGAGRVVHRNRRLTHALSQDPQRAALEEGLARAAADVLALRGRRRRPAVPAADGIVTTAAATYRIHASFADDGGEMVVVHLERAAAPQPLRHDALQARFALTVKEAEVARLLAEGKSNVEIARALFISPHTARHHTEKVIAKMHASSRGQVACILNRPPSAW